MIPPPAEWNAARQHSIDNPTHVLGPYEDAYGSVHMECLGDGVVMCEEGFDTATTAETSKGDEL